MTTLIAVAYPDEGRAADVLNTLRKLKLHQSINLTAAGAVDGAFWGLLVGMIFMLPFPFFAPVAWFGMSVLTAGVGAAAGAIGGHFSDYGIDDQFVKDLSGSMEAGSSALFILVRSSTPDKVLSEVSTYGGTIRRTNLTGEAEAQLRDALKRGQTAQTTAQLPVAAAGA